ncbi:Protein SZT2 [Trichoplax sp. H2]|nr:Protein SZT2 [Trichoplax sp. H2]|eukprot:RDD36404.1 Protein SZT2 [Trichoplax sp. H2]
MATCEINKKATINDTTMDTSSDQGCQDKEMQAIAERVYLLLGQKYHVSRTQKMSWLLEHLNRPVVAHPQYLDCEDDITIMSVIPSEDSPIDDTTQHNAVCRLSTTTSITFLSRYYRFVFLLDLGQALACVDLNSTTVLNSILQPLRMCLEALIQEMCVEGTNAFYTPSIFVSILGITCTKRQRIAKVLIQGFKVTESNLKGLLQRITDEINSYENDIICQLGEISHFVKRESSLKFSCAVSKLSFLLQIGHKAISLLPEKATPGMVIITNGVLEYGSYSKRDSSSLLQLKLQAITCSIIHAGDNGMMSQRSFGYIPYVEALQFLPLATCGVYFNMDEMIATRDFVYPAVTDIVSPEKLKKSFQLLLGRSYQLSAISSNITTAREFRKLMLAVGGDSNVSHPKKYTRRSVKASITSMIGYLLRSGYYIYEIIVKNEEQKFLHVQMLLPFKIGCSISYSLKAPWPLGDTQETEVTLCVLDNSDIEKARISKVRNDYREQFNKRIQESMHSCRKIDDFYDHVSSFSSNSEHYILPDFIRHGSPLFQLKSHGSLALKDFELLGYNRFVLLHDSFKNLSGGFFRQRLFHNYQFGILLGHDEPLSISRLYIKSSTGRHVVVQCQRDYNSLIAALKEWSSFVLVDKHYFVNFIKSDPKSAPISFCLLKVLKPAPYMVLDLYFLVGTAPSKRKQIVSALKNILKSLTETSKRLRNKKFSGRFGKKVQINTQKENNTYNSYTKLIDRASVRLIVKYENIPANISRNSFDYKSLNYWNECSPLAYKSAGLNHFALTCQLLRHQRCIWTIGHPDIPNSLELTILRRTFKSLTRLRLRQGFNFTYTKFGMASMINELRMRQLKSIDRTSDCADIFTKAKDDSKGHRNSYGTGDVSMVNSEWTSCAVQYVIFPPVNDIPLRENDSTYYESYHRFRAESATFAEGSTNQNYNSNNKDNKISDGRVAENKAENNAEIKAELAKIQTDKTSKPQDIRKSRNSEHHANLNDRDSYSPYHNLGEKRNAVVESTPDEGNPLVDSKRALYSSSDKKLKRHDSSFTRQRSIVGESESDDTCAIQHNEEVNPSVTSLVTEWWIEPQYGIVLENSLLRRLDHLSFQDIPTEMYKIDSELICATATYKYLSALCKNEDEHVGVYHEQHPTYQWPSDSGESSADVRVRHVSGAIDIPKFLRRCQHAEILFSPINDIVDDYDSTALDKLAPNQSLYRWFQNVLIHSNDRVIIMGRKASDSITSLFLERSRYITKTSEHDFVMQISWLCFIKHMKTSNSEGVTEHVLVTAVPSSVEELYKLRRYLVADANLIGNCYESESNTNETVLVNEESNGESAPDIKITDETKDHRPCNNELNSENCINLNIPIMVFDSAESMIDVEEFFNNSPVKEENNLFYDNRFEKSFSTSLNGKLQQMQGHDGDRMSAIDKHRESSIWSRNVNKLLAEHCSKISNIYYFCYIYVIHECIQAETPVDPAVIQSAIDELCIDTYAEIDVTTFLRCMTYRCDSNDGDRAIDNKQIPIPKNYKAPLTESQDLRDCIISACFKVDDDVLESKKFAVNDCFIKIVSENFLSVSNSTNLYYHNDTLEEDEDLIFSEERIDKPATSPRSPDRSPTNTYRDKSWAGGSPPSVDYMGKPTNNRIYVDALKSFKPLFMHFVMRVYHESKAPLEIPVSSLTSSLDDILDRMKASDIDLNDPKTHFAFQVYCMSMPVDLNIFEKEQDRHWSLDETVVNQPQDHYGLDNALDSDDGDITTGGDDEEIMLDDPYEHQDFGPNIPSQIKKHGYYIMGELSAMSGSQQDIFQRLCSDIVLLIDDEIISFLHYSYKPARSTLKYVTTYVNRHLNLPTCKRCNIPLYFVGHNEDRFTLFKERLESTEIDGCYFSTICEPNDANIGKNETGNELQHREPNKGNELTDPVTDPQDDCQSNAANRSIDVTNYSDPTIIQLQEVETTIKKDDKEEIKDQVVHLRIGEYFVVIVMLPEKAKLYFHANHAKYSDNILESIDKIFNDLIDVILTLNHSLNQLFLLRELYDQRICSRYLFVQPSDESAWIAMSDSNEELDQITKHQLLPLLVNKKMRYVSHFKHLSMTIADAEFACSKCYSKKFDIHPRLRDRKISSAKILSTALSEFAVTNRTNMYVYKESNGSIFYICLYDLVDTTNEGNEVSDESNVQDKGEGSMDDKAKVIGNKTTLMKKDNVGHLLQNSDENSTNSDLTNRESLSDTDDEGNDSDKSDKKEGPREPRVLMKIFGQKSPMEETCSNLVKCLQARLDEAVLDILSVTLQRNPSTKLSVIDINFIQKEQGFPKCILYKLPSLACKNLHAFVYYLRQNLLTFLNLPRYETGNKANHFKDFYKNDKNEVVLEPFDFESCVFYYNKTSFVQRALACISLHIQEGKNKLALTKTTVPALEGAFTDIINRQHDNFNLSIPTQEELKSSLDSLKKVSSISEYCTDLLPDNTLFASFKIWLCGSPKAIDSLSKLIQKAMRNTLCDLILEYGLLIMPQTMPVASDGSVGISYLSMNANEDGESSDSQSVEESLADSFDNEDEQKQVTMYRETVMSQCFDQPPLPEEYSDNVVPRESCDTDVDSSEVSIPSTDSMSIAGNKSVKPITKRRRHISESRVKSGYGYLYPSYSYILPKFMSYSCNEIQNDSIHEHIYNLPCDFCVELILERLMLYIYSNCPDFPLQAYKKGSNDRFFQTVVFNRKPLQGRNETESSTDYVPSSPSPAVDGKPSYIIVGGINDQLRTMSVSSVASSKDDSDSSRISGNFNSSQSIKFQGLAFNNNSVIDDLYLFSKSEGVTVHLPRQKILIANIYDRKVNLLFYNWTKDMELAIATVLSKLIDWHSARFELLKAVVRQKMGLFHYKGDSSNDVKSIYPFAKYSQVLIACRSPTQPKSADDEIVDFNLLFRDRAPRKRRHLLPISKDSSLQQDVIFRNCHQVYELTVRQKKASGQRQLRSLLKEWQSNYKSSDKIRSSHPDKVDALLKASRLLHYCASPLLINPDWRREFFMSTASRDSVATAAQIASAMQNVEQENCTEKTTLSAMEPEWHKKLRSKFLERYLVYLGGQGYRRIILSMPSKSSDSGSGLASPTHARMKHVKVKDTGGSTRRHEMLQMHKCVYVQKTTFSGIFIIELSFQNALFFVKEYVYKLNIRSHEYSQFKGSQVSAFFSDVCSKLKDVIHVNSFAHDFQLRCIQKHLLSEKATSLVQKEMDYAILDKNHDLASFFVDFMSYYGRSPDFAKNNLQSGNLAIFDDNRQDSSQLFKYLIDDAKTYNLEKRSIEISSEGIMNGKISYILVNLKSSLFSDFNATSHNDRYDGYMTSYAIVQCSLEDIQDNDDIYYFGPYSSATRKSGNRPKYSGQASIFRKKIIESQTNNEVLFLKYFVITTTKKEKMPSISSYFNKDSFTASKKKQKTSQHSSGLGLTTKVIKQVRENALMEITETIVKAQDHNYRNQLWVQTFLQPVDEENSKRQAIGRKSDFIAIEPSEAIEKLMGLVYKHDLTLVDRNLSVFVSMPLGWQKEFLRFMVAKHREYRHVISSDEMTQYLIMINPKWNDMCIIVTINEREKKTSMSELYRCRSHYDRVTQIPDNDSESNNNKRQCCHEHLQRFVDNLCRFAWSKLLKAL